MGSPFSPGFIEEIDVTEIVPSKMPSRDEIGSLEGLVISIEARGLLQPIVVRPVESQFEVVAGNRRLEACKLLKLGKIPCHIVELNDKEAYEVSLIENVQHRTLTPIEEARALQRYVQDYGYGGVSELARRIGKSTSYVSRRLALLKLPNDLLEQLLRLRKTPTIAQELLSLNPEQLGRVKSILTDEKMTREHVRNLVKYIKINHANDSMRNLPMGFISIERKARHIDKALLRCIASLKFSLVRFDEVIDDLDDSDWLLRELLMQYRLSIHRLIDGLVNMHVKTMHNSSFVEKFNAVTEQEETYVLPEKLCK
jgi:ParB family chromosome partitioning protein